MPGPESLYSAVCVHVCAASEGSTVRTVAHKAYSACVYCV